MTHTTPPLKLPNLEKRTREHLLPNEVEAMIKAASSFGRHGYRAGLTQLSQATVRLGRTERQTTRQ